MSGEPLASVLMGGKGLMPSVFMALILAATTLLTITGIPTLGALVLVGTMLSLMGIGAGFRKA